MSAQARWRQKRSRPSSMARVRKGSTTPIRAPRFSKRFAARSTAASTSASTAMPKPASSSRPMRSPRRLSHVEIEPGDVLRRQAHGVALVGLRQHAHHQRRVGDGAGHRPGDAAAIGRIDRDAAEARLQPEDAAPAGRQADRAADVGADVERPVAGRRRGAGAGRASRRGSSSGPTGCGSADGSSTARTTACRNRASSSWRG